MSVVALTGGVAAGKSTVSAVLRELGAIVLDADVFAREAVEAGSPCLRAIADTFGSDLLLETGQLDRVALGALVFHDDKARARLNSIVHPEVRRLAARAIAQAGEENPDTVLVYDVPLLAEARDPGEFDLVAVVDAPAEVRIARLCTERGLTRGEALARVSAQATDEKRLSLADVVLDSSHSLEATQEAAAELFHALEIAWPDRLSSVPPRFPRVGG
jgi:dephospho-CoA kinase